MMGNDCERILTGINNVKEKLQDTLETLAGYIQGPIEMESLTVHHKDGSTDTIYPVEQKLSIAVAASNEIFGGTSDMSSDFSKLNNLKSKLYVDAKSFNNSNGSPWTEMSQLQSIMDRLKKILEAPIEFKSQVFVIMPLVSAAISYAVDAKYALIHYHDYIQRGFDTVYNDRRPSIMFTSGYSRQTVGNISQTFSENVNIPTPTIDPF